MSGHTPGPWVFEKRTMWPFGVKVTAADGWVVLEQSGFCNSTQQKTRADNENGVGFKPGGGEFGREKAVACIATQDANGRLIAAAPELLEALRGLLLRVADDEEYGHGHAVIVARAAIAAATGEQA